MENKETVSLTYLLEITNNDKAEVIEFIKDVITLKNDVIFHLKNAVQTQDLEEIKMQCHKMKSSVKIFGCHQLTQILEEIETQSETSSDAPIWNAKIISVQQSLEKLEMELLKALDILQ